MQVPAPFDYVRATSVGNALELLERHGPESRVIAGGHSLLPMMKLRLARPEWLIDINDVAELDHITEDARRAADRRADPARRRCSPPSVVGRLFPIVHDAERVIADPSSATAARSAARSARPTRPRTSPPSATSSAPQVVIAGPRRRAGRRHRRLPPRPLRDRLRAARADHRDPLPDPRRARAAPTRRSSAGSATGRSAPPAPPLWMAEDGTIADATIGLTALGLEGLRAPTRPAC